MVAGVRRSRVITLLSRGRPPAADGGFSLVEIIVSVGLIGTVMASLGSFYVTSMVTTSAQAGKQGAVQVANDGMERVRALAGSALLNGRDQTSTVAQWQAAESGTVAGVAPYLADMETVYDDGAAAGAGATAALPTTPKPVTVSGVPYAQHFYVGRCWQAPGGACGLARPAGAIEFRRVLVAVTWTEKSCRNSACAYVTATLVTPAPDDPIFNIKNSPKPVVNDPGTQYAYVGEPITALQLTNTGGVPPFTWTVASGLPAGLALGTDGRFTGTPTTAAAYAVTVRITDGINRSDDQTFTWNVAHPPQLQDPAAQSSQGGVAITPYTVPFVAGRTGHGPYTWSATGLPAGLSINPTTGQITGTPTAVVTRQVTVTVTDRNGRSDATAPFTWTIPPLWATKPIEVEFMEGQALTPVQIAGGGIRPYTYEAYRLPPGLRVTNAGEIVGTLDKNQAYPNSIITVTDAIGTTVTTAEVKWKVRQ